jgi:hypothetical protein
MKCSVVAMMGLAILQSSSFTIYAFQLTITMPQHSHSSIRIAAASTMSTENDNDPTTAMVEVELPHSSLPTPPDLNDGLHLSSKEISHMSFRELQRLVRLYHPHDNVQAMTTSRLREALRSLSNLCIIRDDGVEDCSDDFEENVSQNMAWYAKCSTHTSHTLYSFSRRPLKDS